MNSKEEIEAKWEKQWAEQWRPLLLDENGQFDEQKIRNEMHDLVFIYEQVSAVYAHITGGELSKPMYYASVVCEKHDEEVQESYERGFEDGKEDGGDSTSVSPPEASA